MKAPRTLFGQHLLLLVGLIAGAQLVGGLLFHQLVQKPRVAAMIYHTRNHLNAVQAALRQLPEAQRAAYATELTASGHTLVQRGGSISGQTPPRFDYLLRYALGQLQPELGPDRLLQWQRQPQPRLWVRVPVGAEHYWIGLSTQGLLPNMGLPLLWASVASGLLALMGAWLIQRRINRPLRQLVRAAADIGQGQPPDGLPQHAPLEIAQLADSLRQLSASLSQQDRERAIMLAGVSHDLRTPLTKLQLALAMLTPQPADDDLRASMERQLGTIDSIVGQFIDYARVGGGEAAQLTDLNALLERTAHACQTPEQPQHLELQPLPPLMLRPVALTRLLGNLLENARRYAPGPVTLRTRQNGDEVEITVEDSGPGIAPEHLARVQQPFERLESARSGHPGAGLGLAIVERVARLHHGSLTLGPRSDGRSGLVARVRLRPMPSAARPH